MFKQSLQKQKQQPVLCNSKTLTVVHVKQEDAFYKTTPLISACPNAPINPHI